MEFDKIIFLDMQCLKPMNDSEPGMREKNLKSYMKKDMQSINLNNDNKKVITIYKREDLVDSDKKYK